MDPGVSCHGMKANPTGYLWSKYECFLMSGCQDIDFSKTLTKCNGIGNGNAYDRGDYNSSFVLRAVELKMKIYDHGLLPLLMQNPYSKFILVIKMLPVDRFSKTLQPLLRQIEI